VVGSLARVMSNSWQCWHCGTAVTDQPLPLSTYVSPLPGTTALLPAVPAL